MTGDDGTTDDALRMSIAIGLAMERARVYGVRVVPVGHARRHVLEKGATRGDVTLCIGAWLAHVRNVVPL